MRRNRLDRALAMGVATIAILYTISALSLPVPTRRPPTGMSIVIGLLMLGHAEMYWMSDWLRARVGLRGYVALQGSAVVLVGLCGALVPVGVVLYAALTAEVVLLAGDQWGTMPITLAAIVLFGLSALVTSRLYFAATTTMLLAATGVLAHVVGALTQRRMPATSVADAAPPEPVDVPAAAGALNHDLSELTPRENEVLRALANGARSSAIAEELGIAERTVKAHLASIYQKLGVESRTAAVAVALRRESNITSDSASGPPR